MFNSLEKIACNEDPKTPVLNCRISRALEPRNVNDAVSEKKDNIITNYFFLLVYDKSCELGCTKFSSRLSSFDACLYEMAY